MTIISENLLKLMSAADRKQYGKAGWTQEECQQRVDNRRELKLHNDFASWLRRMEFNMSQVIHAPPKRSQLPVGFPDFTIMRNGKTLMIEFKVGKNKPSPKQIEVINGLREDGFTVLVCYDHMDAISKTWEFFGLA